MTRDQALAAYRLIRRGIGAVLRQATRQLAPADLRHAHRQVAGWADLAAMGDTALEMVADVALFEPNQRGRRGFDRFLAADRGLAAAERALALRMAGAWFSLFRLAERHPEGGLWIEDRLAGDRRLWLMDEGLERSAPQGAVTAMRLFDAGPFHAGFGIVLAPGAETLDLCIAARARGLTTPFRHSIAATLYADALSAELPRRRAGRRRGLG